MGDRCNRIARNSPAALGMTGEVARRNYRDAVESGLFNRASDAIDRAVS